MSLDRIESLLKLMKSYEVSELAFEDAEFKVRLRLGPLPVAQQVVAHAPAAAPVVAAHAPAVAAAAPRPAGNTVQVLSPMVGTFFRSPKPGSPPFVEIGQRVRKGQPLCIVEAMKLMNEIESDVDGTVVEILVDNGTPVQFGQVLIAIRPG